MHIEAINLTSHPLPVPATPRSAGLDLKATECVAIPAGGRALIKTPLKWLVGPKLLMQKGNRVCFGQRKNRLCGHCGSIRCSAVFRMPHDPPHRRQAVRVKPPRLWPAQRRRARLRAQPPPQ